MARVISKNWEEALVLAADCKIEGKIPISRTGETLHFRLRDAVGQQFILQIRAHAVVGRTGNILAITDSLEI